jgi:hypothetical protein
MDAEHLHCTWTHLIHPIATYSKYYYPYFMNKKTSLKMLST